MAIHRASDSLSRCDPNLYSNIYDVRKRSDIKHEPIAATHPVHKDSIEISRDKLKEEALNRLRHTTKYVVAQNGFMRIGKTLFFAIALPPYFLLYGLPKWIFVEGIAAIYLFSSKFWKKMQGRVQKRIDPGVQKMAQMIQLMRRHIGRILIQPFLRLSLEIRQGLRRMQSHILRFFQQRKARTKRTLPHPYSIVTTRFKNLQKKLSLIREKFVQQTGKMAIRLQEGIPSILKSSQLLINWGNTQLQRLNEQAASWGVKWNKKFHTSQKLAQSATNWLSHQFKQGRKGFSRALFAPILTLYRKQIEVRLNKLKEACKGRWQQTRDFFHQKHQKALAFLQKKQEKLKRLSYQHSLDRLLSNPWFHRLPLYWQQWMKKLLLHPMVFAMGKIGIKLYTLLAGFILHVAKWGMHSITRGIAQILKACNWLRTSVRMTRQKIAKFLRLGIKAIRTAALYVLYYFLLSTMMSAILVLWGIQSLRDLTFSITRNLSLIFKNFLAPIDAKE